MDIRQFNSAIVILGISVILTACGGGRDQLNSDANATPCQRDEFCGPLVTRTASPDDPKGTRMTLPSIASNFTNQTYPIYIYLPPGYEDSLRTYPVVYSLDGSLNSPRSDAIEIQKKNLIWVGVDPISAQRRAFDYLIQTDDGGRGGAEDYFQFLTQELVPMIEAQYRVRPGERTLEGYSHGGTFVAYAMYFDSTGDRVFKNYISGDPSLWFTLNDLFDREEALSEAVDDLDLNLQIYSGIATRTADTNGVYAEPYYRELLGRNYPSLRLHYRTYDLGHAEMLPWGFADAIDRLY